MTSKILVVDDDRVFLELIHHILEEYISGDIHAFSSSIEAIDFIKQNEQLSLVICDWHMPKADGLKVLSELRKKNLVHAIFNVDWDAYQRSGTCRKKRRSKWFYCQTI